MRLDKVSDDGEVVRLRCVGTVQLEGQADPLESLLGEAGYSKRVLLDLSAVDMIDSSGFSWLLTNHARCARSGGMLVPYAPSPRVAEAMRALGLKRILPVAADDAEARAIAGGRD